MSTTTSARFTPIRFYTALDPYYFSVDNRPLTDLQTNQTIVATGVDSVRNIQEAFSFAFGRILEGLGGSTGFFLGSPATFSSLTMTIPAGVLAMKETDAGSGLSITKIGLMSDYTYTFVPTTTSGESQVIVLEASFVDITGSENPVILDPSNPQTVGGSYLGMSSINVNQGTPAATGSETSPSVTAGHIPLMRFVLTYGDTQVNQSTIQYNDTFWLFPETLRSFNGSGRVPTRETVLRGPVDASGNPAALQAAGSGLAVNLNATSNIDFAFADGYNRGIPSDFTSTVTNPVAPAWVNLTPSTTVYLYVDRDTSTGWLSYGFSTTAPTYAAVAPASPASGDHWFDTVNEVMHVYTTSWNPVQRVFVGTAVTGTNSVTSVTTYGYRTLGGP